LTAWHNGDALVQAVAANNNNTIVVVHSVGPLILEPWIDHPNVTAVVWAGLGGTETGNALTDVLYGDVNPSGRLPYTIAKSPSDYSAQLVTGGTEEILNITYSEGCVVFLTNFSVFLTRSFISLFIDYRHFDAAKIAPRYEFGFGLSYTTFEYSRLSIRKVTGGHSEQDEWFESNWEAGKPSSQVVGGSTALWLHRPAFSVSFTVKNTGPVAGTEIPQLYLHFPAAAGEPPSVLRGFTDVELKPGQTKKVTVTLSRYDLSIWDVVSQSWIRPQGSYSLSVGASSRDIKLKKSISPLHWHTTSDFDIDRNAEGGDDDDDDDELVVDWPIANWTLYVYQVKIGLMNTSPGMLARLLAFPLIWLYVRWRFGRAE